MYSDIRTLSAPELRVRFSTHDIDIETHEEILPSYARLTYDASRMPPIVEQTVLGHLESLEDEVSTQPVDLRSRVSGDDEEVGQRAAQYHGLSGTVFKHIPLREEFRVQRLWLFHHDIRAFTTSVSWWCTYNSGGWVIIENTDFMSEFAKKDTDVLERVMLPHQLTNFCMCYYNIVTGAGVGGGGGGVEFPPVRCVLCACWSSKLSEFRRLGHVELCPTVLV